MIFLLVFLYSFTSVFSLTDLEGKLRVLWGYQSLKYPKVCNCWKVLGTIKSSTKTVYFMTLFLVRRRDQDAYPHSLPYAHRFLDWINKDHVLSNIPITKIIRDEGTIIFYTACHFASLGRLKVHSSDTHWCSLMNIHDDTFYKTCLIKP